MLPLQWAAGGPDEDLCVLASWRLDFFSSEERGHSHQGCFDLRRVGPYTFIHSTSIEPTMSQAVSSSPGITQ